MSWNPTEILHSGFAAALAGVLDLHLEISLEHVA